MIKKNKFYMMLFTLFLAMGLLLTACGETEVTKEQENTTTGTDQSNSTQEDDSEEKQAFPFTYTDATDQDITIEKKPDRIVTLSSSKTEIIFALGEGDEIVGVNDFDSYPKLTEEIERIGGAHDLNVEKILSLKPDLVLAYSSMMGTGGEAFDQLRDSDVKVAVIPDSDSFDDVYETIELIAQMTGTVEKGEEIINDMKGRVDEIVSQVSDIPDNEQPNVWFEIDPTLWTGGQGTFMNEMVEMLNAKNIVGDHEGWFQFSEEQVVALNPDVIIASYGGTNAELDPKEEVSSRSGWEEITAVKENRVYAIDSDIVQTPGPRLVVGLQEYAKAIYPNIFSNE